LECQIQVRSHKEAQGPPEIIAAFRQERFASREVIGDGTVMHWLFLR